MGCDYYIETTIVITRMKKDEEDEDEEEEEKMYETVYEMVGRSHGYFMFEYDSDHEDHDEKYEEYVKRCLTPVEPIILFENGSFISKRVEEKYGYLCKKYSNIVSMVKEQNRWERT
jgi:hypothetical protein